MTTTSARQAKSQRRSSMLAAFKARPRLLLSVLAGVCVWALCLVLPTDLSIVTSAILAWDATCLTFIVAAIHMMWRADVGQIRATAATQDQGQGVILALVMTAAAASIWVIAAELSAAKADQGLIRALRVALVSVSYW